MYNVIPFNTTSSYFPYGLVNTGLYFINIVKQYITERLGDMKTQGLLKLEINEYHKFSTYC